MNLEQLKKEAREELDERIGSGLFSPASTYAKEQMYEFADTLIDHIHAATVEECIGELPREPAKCVCHIGGGYAVCCDECKESLLCGASLFRNEAISRLQALITESV